MRSVELRNLKNIKYLKFEVPEPGVWLLTGENGAGKTTLLGALRRIGSSQAFPIHFPSSQQSDKLDDVSSASVKFTVRGKSVVYSRTGVRWVPIPRRNSVVLDNFNYRSVEFIGATADRISPRDEDFVPNRINAVSPKIVKAANEIFNTDKFDNLRVVNITRGTNPAFVFAHGTGARRRYSSERTFSLGELCVLKLLKKIQSCGDNCLFLIDELEMALHPSAQVRLLRYLQDVAAEKNLTVIFSTHSVSLIKSANRDQLIHLSIDGDTVVPIIAPYPSVVLGSLASVEEKSADIVFYVEDEFAEAAAEPLLSGVMSEKLGDTAFKFPKIQIVPIGGFVETINFLKRHDALMRPGISSFALLDQDVCDETLASWTANKNYDRLSWFDKNKSRTNFLPWTPEVGLFDLYLKDKNAFLKQLRKGLNDPAFDIFFKDLESISLKVGKERRAACKAWFKFLSQEICTQTARHPNDVRKLLGAILARDFLENCRNKAMAAYGPLFA